MAKSKAVVGMDSGPIHLAFATQTPVVCGFTTIQPNLRIPYRGLAKTASVTPNIFCNFCESNWLLNTWNFNNCPRKMQLAECVTKMTSDKFIKELHNLGVFK
jgi:ADP-heptose:LPS heptosyltransferase